jgi:mono/diheme cytochrome c family protein
VRAQSFIARSLVAAVLLGTPALAQDHGDARRGSVLALQTCIACHGVRKGQNSTNPSAPPFTTIAAVKGISAMALNVALLLPHRAMPNIMLDPQERADIVAYILSLKGD